MFALRGCDKHTCCEANVQDFVQTHGSISLGNAGKFGCSAYGLCIQVFKKLPDGFPEQLYHFTFPPAK